MTVNKKHPLFQEYYDKCMALGDEYAEKREKVRTRFPGWQGKDHPAGAELLGLDRQQHAKLRVLQQEYFFLFDRFE